MMALARPVLCVCPARGCPLQLALARPVLRVRQEPGFAREAEGNNGDYGDWCSMRPSYQFDDKGVDTNAQQYQAQEDVGHPG